ncbi:MAG: c-type cytochrome [Rhodospirillaceae bacterium]|nr:c-type cytochrome [Rhodospirillaceae bacterium]MBT3627236.1 c-type cytochrome [Rhodospirillaceae bacterium]MBT3927981.1 c-type cytochrome [Rhodospirillaceae bacterium]MBT4425530.1 c-type cytochrome [Rhodospirillaceae bacterium]MBT5039651.1 c-type cytochrome [Rhodospirillaceae bacterium]
MRIAGIFILSLSIMLGLGAGAPALAEGNSSNGRKIFKECRNCHSARADKYGTFGPNLYRVIGREAGTAAEHNYSPALKNAGFVWTVERLDRWLAGPEKYLPGAQMEFFLDSAEARADVIAYLIAAGKR